MPMLVRDMRNPPWKKSELRLRVPWVSFATGPYSTSSGERYGFRVDGPVGPPAAATASS
jgi:hypothetical protein